MADAGVGEAAAASSAKGAGEAGAGAGAKGATAAGASELAPITSLASAPAWTAAGSSLAGAAGAAGAGAAGTSGLAELAPVTVSGTAGTAGGGGLGALGAGLTGAALGSAAGGGGTPATPYGLDQNVAPAPGTAAVQEIPGAVTPGAAQPGLGIADAGGSLGAPVENFGAAAPGDAFDAGSLATDSEGELPLGGAPSAGKGFASSVMDWLKVPKNALQAGMFGMSLKNALTQPGLPGAAKTAAGIAGPAAQAAAGVIQTGGTGTPLWQNQKASIDSNIDMQIQNEAMALQQAAANSGMGDQNSGVVQQQINAMKERMNAQRLQAYTQVQQQNVTNAVSELTGSNQTLTQIADMQLRQQQGAMQLASQTAELAGWLGENQDSSNG